MGMKSTKEKILLVILGAVVVFALWFLLFKTPTEQKIEDLGKQRDSISAENQELKDQLSVYKRWQDQLGLDFDSDDDSFTKIANYNNIVGLTNELNAIFAPSSKFTLAFSTPTRVEGKDAYRRDIQVNFEAPDYQTAYSIFTNLNNMEHGCLIGDSSLQATEGNSKVSTTISVFEYNQRSEAEIQQEAGMAAAEGATTTE